MSNQSEIELINAANKECDWLQARIDELEKKNRALENYKNQSYRIKNQRHEISNRLNENKKLRALLMECAPEIRSRLDRMKFTIMTSQSLEPAREGARLEKLLMRINTAIGESEEQ